MKKWMNVFLITAVMLVLKASGVAEAVTSSFTVSASIPKATGASIKVAKVDSTTNVFTPLTGVNLSFDPLSFDNVNGIYTPPSYFAIDVGAIGGAGAPDIVVTYTEGANPNGTGKGFGWHSAASFVRIEGVTEIPLANHGPKKLLKDLTGEHFTIADTAGGFFRMYAGIVTGDASTPTGGIPFTNADKSGAYTGTLVVTATIP